MHLPMQPSIPENIIFHSLGMVSKLPSIAKEYLEVRNLTALKVVAMGPPLAGKSRMCKKLSEIYNLQHIDAKAILSAVELADESLQKEVASELSGKGGRVSDANMASLCKLLLTQLPTRNQVLTALDF